MSIISPILDSTGIALEKQAADAFGATVETFAGSTINGLLGGTGLTTDSVPSNRADGSFYAISYAAALATGTSYRPKQKFLFKVEFVFSQEAINEFPNVLGGTSAQDFTFMVRSVDRPKIDFEYSDEVNMYNFRTKVLQKIRHRELTLTFMDDTGNRVMNFFRALMMIYSPITRRALDRENGDYSARTSRPSALRDGNGMMFNKTNSDIAIRSVVNSSVGNVIDSIRVKQIYVDPQEQPGNAVKETITDYLNARLVSFDLDDLTHESSDPNLITMQFDYDWEEIVNVGSLQTTDGPLYNITVPGIGGAPVDYAPVGVATDNSSGLAGAFASIVTNQLGRATQQLTSTAVSRAITAVAGNGRFANLLGSQASTAIGAAVGSGTRNVGSILTGFGGTSRPTSLSQLGIVNDSANGGPTNVIGSTSSNSDPLGDILSSLPRMI